MTLARFPSHNADVMTDDTVSQKYFEDCLELTLTPTLTPGCQSEQAAARVLGYTPVSWDNLSGGETQPWSTIKSWAALTENEKAAAAVLGYIRPTWDNRGRFKPKPVAAMKTWSELSSCADGEITVRQCIERLVGVKVRTWFPSSKSMLLSTHSRSLCHRYLPPPFDALADPTDTPKPEDAPPFGPCHSVTYLHCTAMHAHTCLVLGATFRSVNRR